MGEGLKRAHAAARASRGLAPAAPKLAEIAERIAAHLRRFEASPTINAWDGGRVGGTKPWFHATAFVAGSKVGVTYISYQGHANLTKTQALGYLAWLDAGNVGRHWEWARALCAGKDRSK